ncbi:hypothetical protein ACTZGI_02775 [Rahnella aceris]|uniref:hypothetical protein n=1 Tax=Rahnella sp. (strain Y9602) TaxID=2703885 RepID=UPI003FD08001
MAVYKITYEHRDGSGTKAEELLIESDQEPTFDEVHEAVRRDTVRFHQAGLAGFTLISVAPAP